MPAIAPTIDVFELAVCSEDNERGLLDDNEVADDDDDELEDEEDASVALETKIL